MNIKIGKNTRTMLSLEQCDNKVKQFLDAGTWTTSKGETKKISEFDTVHIINIYILVMRSYMYHAYYRSYLEWIAQGSKKEFIRNLYLINSDRHFIAASNITKLSEQFNIKIIPILNRIGANNIWNKKYIDPIKTKIK